MKRQNKYNKKNTVQICLRLNKKTDADIIEYIELLKKNNISINGTIRTVFRRVLIRTAETPISENDTPELYSYVVECRKIIKNYGGEKSERNQ